MGNIITVSKKELKGLPNTVLQHVCKIDHTPETDVDLHVIDCRLPDFNKSWNRHQVAKAFTSTKLCLSRIQRRALYSIWINQGEAQA